MLNFGKCFHTKIGECFKCKYVPTYVENVYVITMYIVCTYYIPTYMKDILLLAKEISKCQPFQLDIKWITIFSNCRINHIFKKCNL